MKPVVEPLAFSRRRFIFLFLFLAFLVALPVFMFYATGYRYDFWSDKPVITSTGGVYLTSELESGQIYIDEELVRNARVFRQASYIQGLVPGLHRFHLQYPGYHTWVKELKVYPHMVTEIETFNLPVVPQVRPVTPYVSGKGEPVFQVATTSAKVTLLEKASSTIPVLLSTAKATSTFKDNTEYLFLNEQFIAKASTTAWLIKQKEKAKTFGFATTTEEEQELATTTIVKNKLQLFEIEGEVVVRALGEGDDIPYYFCVTETNLATSTEQTLDQFFDHMASSSRSEVATAFAPKLNADGCQEEIVIDRQGQRVLGFTFWPDNNNLILMHREDGIFVTEIDNRAWQNTQPLYRGQNLNWYIENDRIYVKEGEVIFEIYPQIATNS